MRTFKLILQEVDTERPYDVLWEDYILLTDLRGLTVDHPLWRAAAEILIKANEKVAA